MLGSKIRTSPVRIVKTRSIPPRATNGAGTTSGPSPAAPPTSGASTRPGGWCWDGPSWSSSRFLRGRGGDMSALKTTVEQPTLAGRPTHTTRPEALLGRVMGLVAVTVGFSALGAYLGRDLSGATGLVLFIGAFGCIVGLNIAAAKGRE